MILFRVRKHIVLMIAIAIIGFAFFTPEKESVGKVNWMNINSLSDSLAKKPKRIFVKLYTDWCTICKMMEKKTFSKSRIYKPLNEYYYPVAFNAEQKEAVMFNDSLFQFDPSLGQGTHSLAYHLGKESGHLSFPTIVILDEKFNILYKYPSYMSVLNLEEVLYLYKDIEK